MMKARNSNALIYLPLEQLALDSEPIRKELSQAHIQELAESFDLFQGVGVLDPLLVRPIEGGKYLILSGNHRYMALKASGATEAPCHVVHPVDDAQAFLMKLHANTKRKNLSDLESCEALAREKQIYEALFPQTRQGQNKAEPNGQFVRTGAVPYAEVAAKAAGIEARTIRRNVKVGELVQEMPELKEAEATKARALEIAGRKPEERQVLSQALKASADKPRTLKEFVRKAPKQPEESQGDYAYRSAKDMLRMLLYGVDWSTCCMLGRIFELEQDEVFLRIADLARKEHARIKQAADEARRKYS
jgi:ParB-like chromosome segregation protein Spo0J